MPMLAIKPRPIAPYMIGQVVDYVEIERETFVITAAEWYVILAEPKQERTAAAGLIGRRFKSYCPEEPKSIRQNYFRRRVIMRPMFPGYCFVRLDLTNPRWKRAENVPGVRKVLKIDERPIPVDSAAMARIEAVEHELATGPETKGSGLLTPLPAQSFCDLRIETKII